MDFFREINAQLDKFEMSDIVEFKYIEDQEELIYEGLTFLLDEIEETVTIKEGENYLSIMPWSIDYENGFISTTFTEDIFIPPSFGITTLGSSHGFDPKGKTSGFIFWINSVGVMVDPPVDSATWLLEKNVAPKMVDYVILTHCHSDHDAGVMQKILMEGRITLYTTATIFSSFIRKTSLLTGLNEIDLIQLINFIPVTIGKPININGAMVNFEYRLHSIPTIGFEISFKNKKVVYTSDHLNDRKFFKELFARKILTKGRLNQLISFDWEKDVVIHEAGMPPLHTPVDTLVALPDEFKRNVYLVHTDKSKLPEDSGLKISPTGLSKTQIIDPIPTVNGEAIEVLNMVNHIDIFKDIPFSKASEFLSIIKYRKFEKGDYLIKQDEPNHKFFIIIAGKAAIKVNNEDKAIISSGSYFGENSLIIDENAVASIVCATEVIAITVEKSDFIMFVSNTVIFDRLKKLGEVRKIGSWKTIISNSFFSKLTINQKNYLEGILEVGKAEKGDILISSDSNLEYAIFWNSGKALFIDNDFQETRYMEMGNFIGNPKYLLGEEKPNFELVAKGKCLYFKVKWNIMLKFFQDNPRVMLELRASDSY